MILVCHPKKSYLKERTLHCYACNILLSNPQLDKSTTRYYCDTCLEATVEVQLKLAGKEYYDNDYLEVPFEVEEVEEVEVHIKDSDDDNF